MLFLLGFEMCLEGAYIFMVKSTIWGDSSSDFRVTITLIINKNGSFYHISAG